MDPSVRTRYILLAIAISSTSVSSTLAELAGREAGPYTIAFFRLLLATLMLAVPAILAARTEHIDLSARDHLMMAGIGLLLAIHFATWLASLTLTSVASSVVIVTTEALWVPLGAYFLLRERIGRSVWIGIGVAFAGALILVSGDIGEQRFGGNALVGDLLALIAAWAASAYFLAGRRVRQRMSILTYATIVYGWSTIFLFATVLATGDPLGPFPASTYGWLVLFAFVPMILGHTIINYILRWVQPHVVSTSLLAEPVVSAILALIIFLERPSPLVWLGGAVIVLGILVASRTQPQQGTDAPPEP